jgi:acetoin utilization protein AcuB
MVADCMTIPVLTVRPDANLEEAATTMHECGVGCLPVVVGGLVLGLIEEGGAPHHGRGAHAACHRGRVSRH